jgi:hypothetical protein
MLRMICRYTREAEVRSCDGCAGDGCLLRHGREGRGGRLRFGLLRMTTPANRYLTPSIRSLTPGRTSISTTIETMEM